MKLSICLLTRNEEAKIARALRSVDGVADEVIVADTGSTDGTVALAQSLGARVVSVRWEDDFSLGRNEALAQAQGDWILWLNPDEELEFTSRPALAACIQQAGTLVWMVRVWEFVRPDAAAFTETIQPRLFRNRHGVRYRGRLHSGFETPLEALASRHGLGLGTANVCIRRHAYLSTLTEEKLRWAVRLLERELQDRPGQLHYLIEYGRSLLLLRDERGHEALAEAARQVMAAMAAPVAPTPNVGSLLEHVLTSPHADKLPMSRDQAKDLAGRWFPATPPVLWALAACEFQAGRFAESIPFLETLIHLGTSGQYDRAAAFEPGIIGGMAWENLGICFARLRDWNRAEQCFGKLLTLPGFQERGRKHYAWALQHKTQPPADAPRSSSAS